MMLLYFLLRLAAHLAVVDGGEVMVVAAEE